MIILKLTNPDDEADQVYMDWCRESRAPLSPGLVLDEFRDYFRIEYGERSVRDGVLDRMLARADERGHSALSNATVTAIIADNRAGEDGQRITYAELWEIYVEQHRDRTRPHDDRLVMSTGNPRCPALEVGPFVQGHVAVTLPGTFSVALPPFAALRVARFLAEGAGVQAAEIGLGKSDRDIVVHVGADGAVEVSPSSDDDGPSFVASALHGPGALVVTIERDSGQVDRALRAWIERSKVLDGLTEDDRRDFPEHVDRYRYLIHAVEAVRDRSTGAAREALAKIRAKHDEIARIFPPKEAPQ